MPKRELAGQFETPNCGGGERTRSLSIQQVLAKANSYVQALSKIPSDQQLAVPHGHFARDFNNLRKLALEVCPGLDERLLGKYVGVQHTSTGEVATATFLEIETYTRQIAEQLELILQLSTDPTPTEATSSILPANAGHSWSKEEDLQLVREFDAGMGIKHLASTHQRSQGAIRSRLMRLGRLQVGSAVEGATGPATPASSTSIQSPPQVVNEAMLESLTSRQRAMLKAQFGWGPLTDDERVWVRPTLRSAVVEVRPRTLEEVAPLFGVTPERIRQINTRSCHKLGLRVTGSGTPAIAVCDCL